MPGPIVLIGPMGVGKTTIGKKLAKRLNLNFVDTDKEIVKIHGPIPKIFETQGEQYFRSLETDFLSKALTGQGVIATGGGVVTQEANRQLLRDHFVVYLSTTGKHISARLVIGKRPLLKNGFDDWKRIYEERKPLYKSVATKEISTSDKSLNQVIAEIEGLVANV